MHRKEGFDKKLHLQVGKKLKRAYAEILKIFVLTQNKYPRKSKIAKLANAAEVSTGRLQNELDNEFCRENKTGYSPYYGKRG